MGYGCSCPRCHLSRPSFLNPSKGKQDPTCAQGRITWEPKEGTVKMRVRGHVITAIAPPPLRSFDETLPCPILERRMLGWEGHNGSEQGH